MLQEREPELRELESFMMCNVHVLFFLVGHLTCIILGSKHACDLLWREALSLSFKDFFSKDSFENLIWSEIYSSASHMKKCKHVMEIFFFGLIHVNINRAAIMEC